MKKTISLIAIVGLLLLSVSLISNATAAAPSFPEVPDVKLIIGTGLTPAFDLADFNVGDAATAYNIQTNFLGLSALAGSVVNYASYGAATVGDNVYQGQNDGGNGNAQNKLKYSTYRINKLPKVGLNPTDSVDVVVGNYVSPASPPSFGNAAALIVSDTTQVSAIWADANTVTITALTGATGPVNVDVIAAPVASAPYGVDIDKERIVVYINQLPTTAGNTAGWGYEPAPGRATHYLQFHQVQQYPSPLQVVRMVLKPLRWLQTVLRTPQVNGIQPGRKPMLLPATVINSCSSTSVMKLQQADMLTSLLMC